MAKSDVASGITFGLSGFGLWMHKANAVVGEFMPLITAIGIIGSLLLTIWFYRQRIKLIRKELNQKDD